MSDENKQNTENNGDKKNHIVMIFVAVLVVIFFIKFVVPAMDKGTLPPSSILTGEQNDR